MSKTEIQRKRIKALAKARRVLKAKRIAAKNGHGYTTNQLIMDEVSRRLADLIRFELGRQLDLIGKPHR